MFGNVTDNTSISVTGLCIPEREQLEEENRANPGLSDTSLNLDVCISDTITASSSIDNLSPYCLVLFFKIWTVSLFHWFAAPMRLMFVES